MSLAGATLQNAWSSAHALVRHPHDTTTGRQHQREGRGRASPIRAGTAGPLVSISLRVGFGDPRQKEPWAFVAHCPYATFNFGLRKVGSTTTYYSQSSWPSQYWIFLVIIIEETNPGNDSAERLEDWPMNKASSH